MVIEKRTAECYFRALRGSWVNTLFRLEFQPRRELNNARVVCLHAQVEQTSSPVGIFVVRVIEEVEEVGSKPQLHPLGDVEVLEDREVFIPQTGPEQEIVRCPV